MSNDYFKAQGWFKNYARSSEDSRGVFQQLVKEDEEAFRLASAETDKIKNMMTSKSMIFFCFLIFELAYFFNRAKI